MMKVFMSRVCKLAIGCMFVALSMCAGRAIAETDTNQPSLTFHIDVSKKGCQMAIWLVNDTGRFVDTIYVTRKTALKGLGNRGGGLDDRMGGSRLSTLPVWAYQRGVDDGTGNMYPSKNTPLPDAITSATPKAGTFVWKWYPEKKLAPGKYLYFVEVNKSFDDNEHHKYSWYRGQPSVVWQGSILIGKGISKSEAKIIGHGDPAGANGNIHTDLSTLTTALQLISKAQVIYTPPDY